ncbi:MAG: DUF58 domain-containing protein [Patulibacter sp.]
MRRAVELTAGPVLLAIAAFLLGSLTIFAIAIGLAMIYVGAVAAVATAARRVQLDRWLLHDEIVEGQPADITFEVGGIEGLPVRVEFACRCGKWHALPIGRHTVRWSIDRPGPHTLEPAALRIRDDLGLLSRPIVAGRPLSLLVLPEPTAVAPHRRHGAADLAQDPEPDAVQPCAPGTPLGRIHWRTSARRGELMERTFTTARDALPLLIVDTSGAPSSAAVDWAAREAAGHALAFARGGGCRVLLPGDRTPTTLLDPIGGWAKLHRRLADLGAGPPNIAPGGDRSPAVRIEAAAAPPHAIRVRGPLPPGVRGDGRWATP